MGRARKQKGDKVDGWVVLDKPIGMTSTKAVAEVKRIFNARKAGHAGTLDPLASGCLPIALGEATKTVSYAMDSAKTYEYTVRWGIETATDDAEGDAVATSDVRPDADAINAVLPEFTGVISQRPPAFSAIKVAGERAYDLARSGEVVDLPERDITIDRLELVVSADMRPAADHSAFFAECGKGAYIRALARDIGRRLGTYGHVSALRRLSVGPFREDLMIPLEMLTELGHNPPASDSEPLSAALHPVETALDGIPALAMTGQDVIRLKRGQAVIIRGRDAPIVTGLAYATAAGIPVALGEVEQGAFNPRRVFDLGGA